MLRRIVVDVADKTIRQDLERYKRRAIELGATDAKIIRSSDVVVENRVLAKCLFPRCPVSGTNIHCPPHAPDVEKIRRMVKEFQHGLFFKLDGPYDGSTASSQKMKLKNLEIVGKIEAQAYYDSYYLAVGFGGASCKTTLCPEQECSALQPGQPCRHPLRGRPSMHAVGMDAYKMAVWAGWDIYPIGRATVPSDVPFVSHLGVILIY
jgi:predicted metal-binding protein